MIQQLETEYFYKIKELIYTRSSLVFSNSRVGILHSKIAAGMKELGVDSIEKYYLSLLDDNAAMHFLLDAITTKETYFFRLPQQFEILQKHILPEIEGNLANNASAYIGSGQPKPSIKIWSAGCSTGEEPYSIAMASEKGLQYKKAWPVEILATDISEPALRIAADGYYSEKQLNKIPEGMTGEFVFSQNGGGKIVDKLKNKINFRLLNLRDIDSNIGRSQCLKSLDGACENYSFDDRFDIIFCRNVIIYFDFAAQQELVDELYNCLKPGGYLFMGDAELLHIYASKFIAQEKHGAIFYRKPEKP